MPRHELKVVAGELRRGAKRKPAPIQDVLAKRWRSPDGTTEEAAQTPDVIPLMDGWIRKLERDAGADREADAR